MFDYISGDCLEILVRSCIAFVCVSLVVCPRRSRCVFPWVPGVEREHVSPPPEGMDGILSSPLTLVSWGHKLTGLGVI